MTRFCYTLAVRAEGLGRFERVGAGTFRPDSVRGVYR